MNYCYAQIHSNHFVLKKNDGKLCELSGNFLLFFTMNFFTYIGGNENKDEKENNSNKLPEFLSYHKLSLHEYAYD